MSGMTFIMRIAEGKCSHVEDEIRYHNIILFIQLHVISNWSVILRLNEIYEVTEYYFCVSFFKYIYSYMHVT